MNSRAIVARFEEWRARSEPMVLVTVFETIGSTYSKAGHRILIAGDGDYQGLVSGGCLEGDLVERARAVIGSGRAAAVTYDLRDEADELFGLGVGCNGLLRMLMQPVTPATGYEPFASIASCVTGDETAAVATVVASNGDLPLGASLVWRVGGSRSFGVPAPLQSRLDRACADAARSGAARLVDAQPDGRILCAPIVPVPKLLLLGAGVDAVPLVAMADALGWRVTVADHRPAYVERGGFGGAEAVRLVEPDRLTDRIDLDRFDAIVVMSHHLATDRAYLRQLAPTRTAYLGILGPRARRQRLLADLGSAGQSLAARLKGPVGLDIGADSPETIALSILAEVQQELSLRIDAAATDLDLNSGRAAGSPRTS